MQDKNFNSDLETDSNNPHPQEVYVDHKGNEHKARTDYLIDRMKELGISDYNNRIRPGQQGAPMLLTADKIGNIEILVSDIEGNPVEYDISKAQTRQKLVQYVIKRLHPEEYARRMKKWENNGQKGPGPGKYVNPKGHGTLPFFPPQVQEAYRNSTKIKTLLFTEGPIKAIKGSLHGLMVVGLPGITQMKADTQIYADVAKLIDRCQPDNLVMLYDADYNQLKRDTTPDSEYFGNGNDLRKRVMTFYHSAQMFQQMVKDFEKTIYWRALLPTLEGNPKGLDDLLIWAEQRNSLDKVLEAAQKVGEDGRGDYFHTINMTVSPSKVAKHLCISEPKRFYDLHAEQLGEKKFNWNGTLYKFSPETAKLEIITPGEAQLYFRAGVHYYKRVMEPDHRDNLTLKFKAWTKGTIVDDHGRDFLDSVERYDGFVNIPSHTNYQPTPYNHINLYAPFEHEPEPGDCTLSLSLVRHIFGEQYEIGLDYIKLLYERPTQILPILGLISNERHTGKSTFIQWMRHIFGMNCILVGNEELTSSFNAVWAEKLLICCEETLIEKKPVIEKIKNMSTTSRTTVNQKNRAMEEREFFGKFILASNNEYTFVNADDSEIRYWVRKVPEIPEEERVANFMEQLTAEIPAFIHFLSHRKMQIPSPENGSRMWFAPETIETEPLRVLKEASRSTLQKLIKNHLIEYFDKWPVDHCRLSAGTVREVILGANRHQRFDPNYIARELEQLGGVKELSKKRVKTPLELKKVFPEAADTRPYYVINYFRNENPQSFYFFSLDWYWKMERGDWHARIEQFDELDLKIIKREVQEKKWEGTFSNEILNQFDSNGKLLEQRNNNKEEKEEEPPF